MPKKSRRNRPADALPGGAVLFLVLFGILTIGGSVPVGLWAAGVIGKASPPATTAQTTPTNPEPNKPSAADKWEPDAFTVDAKLEPALQANAIEVDDRSKLTMRLPNGYVVANRRKEPEFSEIDIQAQEAAPGALRARINVMVAFVPPEFAHNVESRTLATYVQNAVIKRVGDAYDGVWPNRGLGTEATINGVRFHRAEVSTGKNGVATMYFGVYTQNSWKLLVSIYCRVPSNRTEDQLPLLEAAVRTLKQ